MAEVFIGYDPRESDAFKVCASSITRNSSVPVKIRALKLDELRQSGLYTRDMQIKDGRLWDTISGAPCSTEFAISRFLVPHLASEKWSLFVDCDMLFLWDIAELFALADDRYAVMCTKHVHLVSEGTKMDGQKQLAYSRKNWSSCMLFNNEHPANAALTVELINTVPGRDLHRLCWLQNDQIGDIPLEWNHLIGEKAPITGDGDIYPQYDYSVVKNAHFTLGLPNMPGYENCDLADWWREELELCS